MTTRVLAYSDSKVFGGAEAVFCDIVAGLRGRPGLDLVTAAPRANARLSTGLTDPEGQVPLDVPAQALPLAAFDLYNPLRLHRVKRAIGAVAADVLLVNLPSPEYGAAPLRLDLPVSRRVGLLHIHGSPRDLGFRLGFAREALARRALASLDLACVLSDSAAGFFRSRWDGGGTQLQRIALPRPRVERVSRSVARRRLGLAEESRWVGIAGRISIRQKGHDTFVAAASRLSAANPDLRFAVAGEGRDRRGLEDRVRDLGLAERFLFLGEVRPIDPFLAALDAIVIPSRFEGLPLIALEALTAGLPGVASDIDGLRDVWPAEWLTPAGNPEALAEAVSGLLGSPQDTRESILRAARTKMEAMTADDPAAVFEKAVRL